MKENPEFNILFVSKVQQFPCLYDNTSLDYSNKSLQLKAWETIASQVNESDIMIFHNAQIYRIQTKKLLKIGSNVEGAIAIDALASKVNETETQQRIYEFSIRGIFILKYSAEFESREGEVIDCKDRWKNLRGCFTRHLKNKSEESSSHRYRKPYYLARHLNFLLPFTKSRLLVSNDMCDSIQNEDEDTMADEDCDDYNSNNSNAHDVNGDDAVEDYEEQYLNEERQDTDETKSALTKRSIKTETAVDINTKWQNSCAKKMRVDRPVSDDSDLLFLKSLLPDIRAMDGSQKRRLKIGILQLCEDILNEATFRT